MLKGLAITPPILGRISIGKLVEKNGKRVPEKDDQFTLTSQVQNRDRWLLHPLNEELRNGQDGKLRSIPIRLLFNEFDQGRHPVVALSFTRWLLTGPRQCLQTLRPAERGDW